MGTIQASNLLLNGMFQESFQIEGEQIHQYSRTPRIGAEGCEFAFFPLQITSRIGAPFAYRGTLPRTFLLSNMLFYV